MAKSFDYRKYYTDYYGIEIPILPQIAHISTN